MLAKELANSGHRMIVVCASDHHLRHVAAPAEAHNYITVEQGIEFLQLRVRSYHGNGLQRLLNIFDYCIRIRSLGNLIASGILPKPDVIIGSSAPLFVFSSAHKLARDLKAGFIFEVRDIWPMSLIKVAGVPRWHPLVLWMDLIEHRAYRQADAVVSLLPNAFEHMHARGLTADRFSWIPNGISLDEWLEVLPLPDQHQELFTQLRSSGKTIVLYSGAHGPPNALEQILDLNRVIGIAEVPYHFVMIGDGISKIELVVRAQAERCSFIDFLPRVSKAQSLAAIRQADICYIGWQDKPIYRYGISPNKISEYMYAQKPVVHAVPETKDPVKEARAGISVKPFDPEALDAALRTLCAMSAEQRAEFGRNGRKYVLENLEWSVLARKYEVIMKKLIKQC